MPRRVESEQVLPHEFGAPPRPKGKGVAFRRAWNDLVRELLALRKLAQDDAPLLIELIQARAEVYRGAGERKQEARERLKRIQSTFDARPPFPEVATPAPDATAGPENDKPAASLEKFLADVRYERSTFASRVVPGQTVCRDFTGLFTWPEGHAVSIARRYCEQVTKGEIVACELIKCACARQLQDLEHGHERGLFFDPLAAHDIARWYEDFCGLKLEAWELFIATSLFGWKNKYGARRFSEAWISVGKKNGKTSLASGIGLFALIADQEKYAEVYSVATKKDQARLCYRDGVRAVRGNPELKALVKEFTGTNIASLLIVETDCKFEPLASEEKTLDGLRPSVIICDEVHEWQSRDVWDKLTKGTVSRIQPLVFAITTAGESETCFAYGKNALATKILHGVLNDDTTFAAIYQLDSEDDFRDESCWLKANPNLGVSLHPAALRKILAEAVADPSGQSAFERYHANRWVSFKQGRSIPVQKWEACRGADYLPAEMKPFELRRQFLEDNFTDKCWGGLDLGLISDLSCYVLLFPLSDHVTIVPFFWMPEHGLLEKERAWEVPLSTWAREGWIKLIEGDMCDPRIIRHDILDLCQNGPGKIQSISFDPWQARVLMSEIAEHKVCECREVAQKPSELTTPAREFKQAIWNGSLWHLNNPVLRWMSGNVVLEEDDKHGGFMPKKLSPKEKIDGIQATISAWHGWLNAPKISSWDGVLKWL